MSITSTDTNVSSSTAVVKGAVLRGIGLGAEVAPKVEFCPRHYGVCVNERYEQSTQSHKGSQTPQRSSRIMWIMRQGDSIVPGIPCKTSLTLNAYITRSQYRAGSSIPITFVATEANEPPLSLSGLLQGMCSAIPSPTISSSSNRVYCNRVILLGFTFQFGKYAH
jgi:hypothetical protein